MNAYVDASPGRLMTGLGAVIHQDDGTVFSVGTIICKRKMATVEAELCAILFGLDLTRQLVGQLPYDSSPSVNLYTDSHAAFELVTGKSTTRAPKTKQLLKSVLLDVESLEEMCTIQFLSVAGRSNPADGPAKEARARWTKRLTAKRGT